MRRIAMEFHYYPSAVGSSPIWNFFLPLRELFV